MSKFMSAANDLFNKANPSSRSTQSKLVSSKKIQVRTKKSVVLLPRKNKPQPKPKK